MLTTVGKVRDFMGLGEDTGMQDSVIIELIRTAQNVIKRDLFFHHYDETPSDNWRTGASWNGSNVSFTVDYPLMDSNFDGSVDGNDLIGYWFNNTSDASSCSFTVINSRYGHVNIYQSDGSSAIPGTADDIRLEYWTLKNNISSQELEDLCTYLTCHLLSFCLKRPEKITIADIEGNTEQLRELSDKNNSVYKTMYNEILNKTSNPKFKAV